MSFRNSVTFVVAAFISTLLFANQSASKEKIILFDNEHKNVLTLDINSKQELNSSAPIPDLNVNPNMIVSHNNIISIHNFGRESEYVMDLTSGEVHYNPDEVGTIVVSKNKRFYFYTPSPREKSQLVFDYKYNKKVLSKINGNIPVGFIAGDEAVSWFTRFDHRLIVVDFNGKLLHELTIECSQAIYLGRKKNILCVKEAGKGFELLDINGQHIKKLEGFRTRSDYIVNYSSQYGKIYFTRRKLSLKFDEYFLTETIHLYSYNIKNGNFELLLEHVPSYGINVIF